jgi:hypothetical protein
MSITVIKTWADGEQLTAADLNSEFDNIYDNALNAATQNQVNAMTSTTTALTPNHNLTILGTGQNTTSGTAITFSNIPAGIMKLNVHLMGVSTSGTSNLILQLGDAGGAENTGYLGSCTTIAGATPSTSSFTAGMGLTNAVAAASIIHGHITLIRVSSSAHTWTGIGILSFSNATTTNLSSTFKTLSAELTQVVITTAGGADTFDAGAMNITYER